MNKSVVSLSSKMIAAGLLLAVSLPAAAWANAGSVSNPATKGAAAAQSAEQLRLEQLELAVRPDTAEKAIDMFVKSLQTRNGALLFAILTPEEKPRSYAQFAGQNWVLGGSSPWVKGYRVVKSVEKDDATTEYNLQLFEYTSLGYLGNENVAVTVKKQEGYWLIDKYTPVQYDTGMEPWSEQLTNETVLGLVAEAQKRYWYLASGGKGYPYPASPQFTPAGTDTVYRWLSEDIDTTEELTAYLRDVYAADAVQTYLNDLLASKQLIVEGERLAQPDADSGSLRDWGKAKVVKLQQNGQQATATLEVPLGESETETFTVSFVYEKNGVWRIATSPRMIR
ncbi:hypothetical protein G3578_15720 [Brevibacillus sp. SYP-B805]|uniref:DL-endopeptidase inhibitor IseA family protein n=1 Tax=Brevibacillus sp. SYP-B805 TaxID=1578199 RepID=UPI0013ED0D75|nr:DL-endopeptidase inhibitor IseA family protein [Brevibacillus sp. SYP-B805]NGQ96611.1 hypothetical protein [Brevibacillus sp. SYP-B805]